MLRTIPRIVAVSCAASSAWAQTPCVSQPQVDALEEQGRALREQHRDADALALFEQAHGLCHGGRALARVALAEAALGRWVDAEAHLRAAMAQTDDAWVSANGDALRGELGTITAHLGDLELPGHGGPAEVWIDNHPVGAWPSARAIRVVAGSVTVSVRGDGFAPVTRTVVVPAGGLARETIELVALSSGRGGDGSRAPRAVTSGGGGQRTVAWVLAGGAVAALAGGAVATGLRFANHDGYFAAYTTNTACNPTERDVAMCGVLYQQGVDDDASWGVWQGVGFGLGGALAVAAAVVFATAPSARSEAVTALRCGQGPGMLGVGCSWQF